MVALLLKKKTRKGVESSSKTRSSSKPEGPSNTPPKDKGKRPERTDDENHTNDELVQSSAEGEESSGHEEDPHSKKMKELEVRLEAIAHRDELQRVGVVRLYPAEWDDTPYPPKFKAPSLHTLDGKGSPNQHIYYFKS